MKFFSSILALYMMVLFMTPCADQFDEEEYHSHEHSTETSHSHGHHDHEDTTDLCTPFCVCSCCGVISGIILQEILLDFGKLVDVDLSTSVTHYKSVFILRYFGEIWQPPKINA